MSDYPRSRAKTKAALMLLGFFSADTRAEQSAGDLKGREVLVDVEFLHEVTRRKYMALPPADGGRKDELTCC